MRKNGTIERSLNAVVNPRTRAIVPWDGLNNLGAPARGKFTFIVRAPGGRPIPLAKRYARGKGGPKIRFGLYDHIFPVRGKHSYGDGIGAPRGDHTHQGQDLSAACGTKIVAAQGGTVQVNAFQAGGAGYYVVIDTAGSDIDHVYMHLAGPAGAHRRPVRRAPAPLRLRRQHRQLQRLPPALRDVVGPRLVRGRRLHGPDALAARLGQVLARLGSESP